MRTRPRVLSWFSVMTPTRQRAEPPRALWRTLCALATGRSSSSSGTATLRSLSC